MKRFDDAVFYNIQCDCHQGDHAIDLSVEVDDCNVTMHISQTTTTAHWRQRFGINYNEDPWLLYVIKEFANDWCNRFSAAFDAIFKGYIKSEAYLLMSQEQAVNVAAAIRQGVDEMTVIRDRQLEDRKENGK